MSSTSEENVTAVQPKSRKPSESAFKQQRLAAWQPIITASSVLPLFFLIGLTFIPLGITFLHFSDVVNELEVEYTHCASVEDNSKLCADIIANNPNAICTCKIKFALKSDFEGKVFMYYGLTNYYQNHRRYVKSRDDYQLMGYLSNIIPSECVPFAYEYDNKTHQQKPIAPCGAIANSLFSDELQIYYLNQNNRIEVPLLNTGIAWPSDRLRKFRNPDAPEGLKKAFAGFAKPKAWKKHIYELDPNNESNNGFQNEDLIVWMRTAALPTFRKLYRRIDHSSSDFSKGLKQGDYELVINYNYDVKAFDGEKRMILSTTSFLGGKNPFLGIAYITVGCIVLVLAVALLFVHIKYGRSVTELININPHSTWPPP